MSGIRFHGHMHPLCAIVIPTKPTAWQRVVRFFRRFL